MLFGNLELENEVQVGDRTRLNAEKSFVTPDEDPIIKMEIKPDAASDWIDVTTAMYLDWAYSSEGVKTVSLRITTGTTDPEVVDETATITKDITVLTAAEDALFAGDYDLQNEEPEILKWTRAGRNSFLDMHRRAAKQMIQWLDREGYTDVYQKKLTRDAILDAEEVKNWAIYLTLKLIFQGLSNATDDVFKKKEKYYLGLEEYWRSKLLLRLDVDGDGENTDQQEGIDIRSAFVARR